MSFYRVIGVGGSFVFQDSLLFCQANIAPEKVDSSMSLWREYICRVPYTDLNRRGGTV
jgi:hypothetical protein